MKSNFIKRIYLSLFVVALMLFSTAFIMIGYSSVKEAHASSKVMINVDTLSYDKYSLPNGVAGKTYPVFSCSAVDGDGNEISDIAVLIYNPDGELVPICDNRFSTDNIGYYMLVYKATNGVTETLETLRVKVVDNSAYTAPYYIFNSNVVSNTNTGLQVALYEGEYGGGNGELKISSQIEYNGDYNPSQLTIENYGLYDYFIPTVAGNYTVTYTVKDIVGGEGRVSKVITVTDSKKPIMREPSVQASAIVNEKISLPDTEAIVYANGKQVYVPVKVFVNTTDVTESMNYIPKEKGMISIRYEAVNNLVADGQTEVYEQILSVVDTADNLTAELPYIVNSFSLVNFNAAYRENSLTQQNNIFVLSAQNAGEAIAKFRVPLPYSSVSMRFGVDAITNVSTSISFKLTDSFNSEKSVTVSLKVNEIDNKKVDVYVAGEFIATIEKNLVSPTNYDESTFDFVIDYTTDVLTEKVSGKEICKVTTYDNGKVFSGFDSGKVYMALSASEVASDFTFKISQICEQSISSSLEDTGNPNFDISENFDPYQRVEYMSDVTIEPVKAFDLMDEDVIVSVSIVSPDRKEIYYNADFTSAYTFKIEQNGNYNVVYEAVDSSGNFKQLKCFLMVVDRTAPVIEAPEIKDKVKVGDTLKLPEVVATDNSGDEQIVSWIYVTYGNYERVTIVDGSYTFEKKGTYLIKYGAEDYAGNFTVLTYTVVCD